MNGPLVATAAGVYAIAAIAFVVGIVLGAALVVLLDWIDRPRVEPDHEPHDWSTL